MGDFNATISNKAMGTYNVRVRRLDLDVTIVTGEAEGRSRRVLYPASTTSSAFSLTLQFPSYESRTRFSDWMRTYMGSVLSTQGFQAACTVSMPSRAFERSAVPTGPLTYGEGLMDLAYEVGVGFVGANDVVDISLKNRAARSYFVMPTKNVAASKNFYPAAKQLSGTEALDEDMFNEQNAPGRLL